MSKVISYVHRHAAQGPSKNVETSKWRYSLMNWWVDLASTYLTAMQKAWRGLKTTLKWPFMADIMLWCPSCCKHWNVFAFHPVKYAIGRSHLHSKG